MPETKPYGVHFYLPHLHHGGAQKVVIWVANDLARAGREVHLLANTLDGFWHSAVDPAVQMHDLGARDSVRATRALRAYIRETRPDLLVAAMDQANLVALLARSLSRSPTRVVIAEHHALSEWLKGRRLSRRLAYGTLIRRLYPSADAIVAVARAAAEDLAAIIGIPTESIDVIYNAAPAPTEGPLGPVPHPWLEPGAPPVVLGVGRLEAQKDFATLIDAHARLRRRREVRLMLLGDGALRHRLAEAVAAAGLSDSVHIAGQVREVAPYLSRCAVLAVSSRYEGFPMSIVEALSCGTPIVSTDCLSGPRELLLDGSLGRLVPVADAEALADAIEATLDDPGDAQARRRRAAELTSDRTTQAYARVFDRVMAHPAGRR